MTRSDWTSEVLTRSVRTTLKEPSHAVVRYFLAPVQQNAAPIRPARPRRLRAARLLAILPASSSRRRHDHRWPRLGARRARRVASAVTEADLRRLDGGRVSDRLGGVAPAARGGVLRIDFADGARVQIGGPGCVDASAATGTCDVLAAEVAAGGRGEL